MRILKLVLLTALVGMNTVLAADCNVFIHRDSESRGALKKVFGELGYTVTEERVEADLLAILSTARGDAQRHASLRVSVVATQENIYSNTIYSNWFHLKSNKSGLVHNLRVNFKERAEFTECPFRE